jgi:ribonucleoside-diphosphate reductase alpha chain
MTIKINLERDKLFDALGLQRLRESYMMEEEVSPQERFAYVSEAFGSNPEHSQRLYEYSSKHWLSYSTPILSFGRSKRGLPISCFLNYIEDSAEGLVDNLGYVTVMINQLVLCHTSKCTMLPLWLTDRAEHVGVLMQRFLM